MRIRLLLFGVLKDILGREQDAIDLPPDSPVSALLALLRARAPQPAALWQSVAVAVNREYAPASRILRDDDEVAILPPVSGGSLPSPADQPEPCAILTREPIDAAELAELLKRPPDGALVTFDGIVRDNTRGRPTLFLDYEAYDAMALEQMRRLAADARQRFAVRGVLLVHRLGRLQVGETSVWIGVSSPHRAAAFDAARFLIDTLKKTIPIWKKEHFEDGSVWTDGEPFPPEIISPLPTPDPPAGDLP
jgi:molybdopterin synthase catalytic subunit/molybdopterin converting factor small subunit